MHTTPTLYCVATLYLVKHKYPKTNNIIQIWTKYDSLLFGPPCIIYNVLINLVKSWTNGAQLFSAANWEQVAGESCSCWAESCSG